MSTKRKIPDDLEEMQDEITDMLLMIHERYGAQPTRGFLRLAVINYIEEAPVSGHNKRLQRIQLLNKLAEAITIPHHLHHAL